MSRRKRSPYSKVERDAVRNSKGPRRATPGVGATKEQRREHSRKMERASKIKALDTRETRQARYQEQSEFQGINSGHAAMQRKGKGNIMLSTFKSLLAAEFLPDGFNERSSVIDTADHVRYVLGVKPAVREFVRDTMGNVVRDAAGNPKRETLAPAEYCVAIVTDTGDAQVQTIGGAAQFRNMVAQSAILDGHVDAGVPILTPEHLRFVYDVIAYGEHEARTRKRMRALSADVRVAERELDVEKAKAKAKAIAQGKPIAELTDNGEVIDGTATAA